MNYDLIAKGVVVNRMNEITGMGSFWLYPCRNCTHVVFEHADDGKCLFEPTVYDPVEVDEPFHSFAHDACRRLNIIVDYRVNDTLWKYLKILGKKQGAFFNT